jgi:hypothetical protein
MAVGFELFDRHWIRKQQIGSASTARRRPANDHILAVDTRLPSRDLFHAT